MTRKAAKAPAPATIMPPTAGPMLRAILKLIELSATAWGSTGIGTCSLTDACHAGQNSAMPPPTMKQKSRRSQGLKWPLAVSSDSPAEPSNEIDSATSDTRRRSYISAIAPAGTASSMIGSMIALCTSAIMSAALVS